MAHGDPPEEMTPEQLQRAWTRVVPSVLACGAWVFAAFTVGGLVMEWAGEGAAPVATVLGLPLFHTGVPGIGWFSCGGLAIGGIAVGGGALGVIAVGGAAVGIVALGGGAIGVIAFGGGAVGYIAIGGGAFGRYVLAGGGRGRYLLTPQRQDEQAVRLFTRYWPRLRRALAEDSILACPECGSEKVSEWRTDLIGFWLVLGAWLAAPPPTWPGALALTVALLVLGLGGVIWGKTLRRRCGECQHAWRPEESGNAGPPEDGGDRTER
jgi:hypothetical protein